MLRVAVSPTIVGAERRLSMYGRKLSEWMTVWEEIGKAFGAAEMALFQSEGATGGGENAPWKPLKDTTIAQKAKLWPGRTILVASGELERSLTEPARAMQILGPDVMIWRSDVMVGDWSLADLHYFGTSKMPARNPIISIELQRTIAREAVARHVVYP